jgi:hypothetical protein
MANGLGHYCEGNFTATLKKDGLTVATRHGHNVITAYAKEEWLPGLVSWETLGAPADVPSNNNRLRWIGIGSGWRPEVPGVKFLELPLPVDYGPPAVYLAEVVPGSMTRPVVTSIRINHTFAGADIAELGDVDLTEFGLYAGYKDATLYYPEWEPGTRMDPDSAINPVVAYKSFIDPLTVAIANTLVVEWEIRF